MKEPGSLSVSLLPKPWGRTDLPELYGSGSERIGEIWFERPEPLRDILAKYLFTDEKLSVQVHPTAANSPTQRGKDECWLITEAGEDAVLALGFRQDVEREHIRARPRAGWWAMSIMRVPRPWRARSRRCRAASAP